MTERPLAFGLDPLPQTSATPDRRYGRFLVWTGAITLFALLGLLAFNFAIEARIVQADGTTALEDAGFKHRIRVNKALAVARVAPATLILGNSRALYAYRPDHPGWPQQPVYNVALPGGTLYEDYRYFTHVLSVRTPALTMLSFDLASFLDGQRIRPDFSELAMRTDAEGATKIWPFGDRLVANLSLALLPDNIAVLLGQHDQENNRFFRNGRRDGQHFLDVIAKDPEGPLGYFKLNDRIFAKALRDCRLAKIDDDPLVHLRRIVELAVSRRVPLVLVFDPVHIRRQVQYWLAGGLESYDTVRRAVAEIAAAGRAAGGDVRVYDFTGVSPYTTELPSAVAGAEPLPYFFEGSHFRPALGDLILNRVLGTGTVDPTFGIELRPESIESYLTQQRAELQSWTDAHAAEVAAIASALQSVCQTQKSK